jgi:hypothetical protein
MWGVERTGPGGLVIGYLASLDRLAVEVAANLDSQWSRTVPLASKPRSGGRFNPPSFRATRCGYGAGKANPHA